jgi:multimeric flavodoxin WrbA
LDVVVDRNERSKSWCSSGSRLPRSAATNGSKSAKGEVPVAVITLAEEAIWSLFYHDESKVVHHQIKGSIRGKEFRAMLSLGADCLEKNRATKWLSDDRLGGIIAPEDNEWGDTMWARRAIKAGLKHWAIVVPKNAVGNMQMQRLANEYRKRGVTVNAFADLETALAWLTSVD